MHGVVEQAVPHEDHADLLVRCGQGDQTAFAALYGATADRVFGMALRVLRDRVQAEDVAHEAYIEVWRSASRFDPSRGTGRAWILTIAHRKAVDRARSAAAARRRDAKYCGLNQTVDYDSTSDLAMRSVEAERVRVAVSRLPPLQRQAVELAYFGALTYTEVATALRIPHGTAKTRIRAGLTRLREEWPEVA